jgi:predicted O-linked N-acetylglucosamine transferase (SPINDLY family)
MARSKTKSKRRTAARKSTAHKSGAAPARSTPETILSEVRRLITAGDYDGAEGLLGDHADALAERAEAHFLQARVDWMKHRPARAEQAAAKAVELAPGVAQYHNELGLAKRWQFRYFEASIDFLNAIRLEPKGQEALNNLATNYVDIGDSRGAVNCFAAMLKNRPNYPTGFSNLLFTMNYLDDLGQAELYAETRRYAERFQQPDRAPAFTARSGSRTPGQRLRVGFVSADFRDHPVAQFFEPLVDHIDRSRFELALYSNLPAVKADKVTERLRAAADIWHDVEPMSDDALVRQIVRDRVDVLVDLSGHTAGNRLKALARKPAPVQITWLGYPNTTGLDAFDYRVTDEIVEPGFGACTSETPELLADGFHCYRPPEGTPAVAPTPALENGYITFGSLNNLAKVTHKNFRMWAAILREVPDARLKMKAKGLADHTVRERICQVFEDHGIDRARLEFQEFKKQKADHLGLMREIDIALDSAPYTGTTTTCDCLWMGVPVITVAGDTPAARVSASLLHRVGLEPLVAQDEEGYVKNAVELASDVDRLAALRAEIRPAFEASPLRDEAGFAARFATMIERVWAERGDADQPASTPAPAPAATAEQARVEAGDRPAAGAAVPAAAQPDASGSDAAESDAGEIRVLHHLARTGGTLISKCLGSMDGVVLLSEAHPDGLSYIDPIRQAQEWFGLIDTDEAAAIRRSRTPFETLIDTAAERCRARGQQLVIRDWTHLDFTGVPFVRKPSYRLTTSDRLARRFGCVIKTATVRHPIDQWLSLNRLQIMQGELELRAFLRGYRTFAERAAEIGFVRYEDFTADPEGALQTLCQRLQLGFDPGYAERWPDYAKVTGDVADRAGRQRTIQPGRAKTNPEALVGRFAANADCRAALEILGYSPLNQAADGVGAAARETIVG